MTSIALVEFLADTLTSCGAGRHTYVVGGAVRNHLMGLPAKDIDVVVDSVRLGHDSDWVARQLQGAIPTATNLTTNQYGVAILTIKGAWNDLQGEVIEIANARKESYGGAEGKGYKPHMVEPATIEEDLLRREFTVNTLLWKMSDFQKHGVDAPVLDLLGRGITDLQDRVLVTPVDPEVTFSDDPTRILRAVKFGAKYKLLLNPQAQEAAIKTRHKLKEMPWDAVRKILVDDILKGPDPASGFTLLATLDLDETLKEMLEEERGFATALGRETKDLPITLALDLAVIFEWPIRHPLSMLSEEAVFRFWERTYDWQREQVEFLAGLIGKPPLDQQALFKALGLEGKDRAKVVQVARDLLVDWPLERSTTELQREVESRLSVD